MTETSRRSRFALAFFFLFAIYGVASPYLQLLVKGLGYGPAAVGLFLGLFEVVGIFGPMAVSRAADRSGRLKPTLIACAAMACASLPPLVLLKGPVVAVLSLSLLALGLKSMVPIMDSAAIAAASNRPGWDYGRLRAAGSVGFVAIALALQLAPGFDRSPPTRIALWVGGAALAFGLCLFFLPENLKRSSEGRAPAPTGAANGTTPSSTAALSAGRPHGSLGVFILGLAVIALGRLAMAPISSFFSLYLVDEVKWDAVGGMWALAAAAEVPLMILSGRIIGALGPMRAVALGSAAIALRLSIYALFPCPAGIVAAQLLHSLCFGLMHPAGVAFVALCIRPDRRAAGMAAYMGLGVGLPTFAGSALGGLIVESWGYRVLFGSFIVFALAAMALYAAKRKSFASA
jgi:MFS transporter, PPP family, 3-phenylpropionic acid transporter